MKQNSLQCQQQERLLHEEGLLDSKWVLNRPYPTEQTHPLPLTPVFLGFVLFIA